MTLQPFIHVRTLDGAMIAVPVKVAAHHIMTGRFATDSDGHYKTCYTARLLLTIAGTFVAVKES